MSSHWTGSTNCRTSSAATSAALPTGFAVALEYTGMRGSEIVTSFKTCAARL